MKPVVFLYGKENDRIAFVNSAKQNDLRVVNYKATFDNEESIRLSDFSQNELFAYYCGMIQVFEQKAGDILLLHDCPVEVARKLMDVFCFPIHAIHVGFTNKNEFDKVVIMKDLDEEVKSILNIITK